MNRYPLFDLRKLLQIGALFRRPKPGEAQLEAVSLDAFPFLFIMQFFQGFSGLVFGGAWFLVLMTEYPQFWNGQTKLLAVGILVCFAIIAGYAVLAALQIVYRSDSTPTDDMDRFARRSMTWLVIGFAITCCLLIWLTDGISSPFIPFYVMVFTLILTRCSIPHPGQTVLLFYGVLFAIACGVGSGGLAPAVDAGLVRTIETSPEKAWADFAFILLSMVIPYLGTWTSAWLSSAMAGRAASKS